MFQVKGGVSRIRVKAYTKVYELADLLSEFLYLPANIGKVNLKICYRGGDLILFNFYTTILG